MSKQALIELGITDRLNSQLQRKNKLRKSYLEISAYRNLKELKSKTSIQQFHTAKPSLLNLAKIYEVSPTNLGNPNTNLTDGRKRSLCIKEQTLIKTMRTLDSLEKDAPLGIPTPNKLKFRGMKTQNQNLGSVKSFHGSVEPCCVVSKRPMAVAKSRVNHDEMNYRSTDNRSARGMPPRDNFEPIELKLSKSTRTMNIAEISVEEFNALNKKMPVKISKESRRSSVTDIIYRQTDLSPNRLLTTRDKPDNQESKAKILKQSNTKETTAGGNTSKPFISVRRPSIKSDLSINNNSHQETLNHKDIFEQTLETQPKPENSISSFRINKKSGFHRKTFSSNFRPKHLHDQEGLNDMMTHTHRHHARYRSDVVDMKDKIDKFMKTADFSSIYDGDPFKLLKIHHKMII